MVERERLHRELSDIFPQGKDFLIKMFINEMDEEEIRKAVENLKGKKIRVKFRDEDVKKIAGKYGSEVDFYNAFLDVLLEKKGGIKGVKEAIKRWKKESFIQYL